MSWETYRASPESELMTTGHLPVSRRIKRETEDRNLKPQAPAVLSQARANSGAIGWRSSRTWSFLQACCALTAGLRGS